MIFFSTQWIYFSCILAKNYLHFPKQH